MKKIIGIIATVALLLIVSCAQKQVNKSSSEDPAISLSQSVNDVSSQLADFDEMSGNNLASLADTQSNLQLPSSNGIFAPLSNNIPRLTCKPAYGEAGTHECTYTHTEFPPDSPIKEIKVTFEIDFGAYNTPDDDIIYSFEENVTYNDGATSVVTLIEDPAYPGDKNLLTGWVIYNETKYFPEEDERNYQVTKAYVNQGEDRYNVSDNLIREAVSKLYFKNGGYAFYSITATPPTKNGFVSGKVEVKTLSHWGNPDIDLKDYTEVVTLTTDLPDGEKYIPVESARYSEVEAYKVITFKDGSVATEIWHKSDNKVEFQKEGRKGVTASGYLAVTDGTFKANYSFPDSSPVVSIRVEGQMAKFNGGHGYIKRVVTFRDGTVRTFTATIILDMEKHVRTLNFERSDGWKGILIQHWSRFQFVTSGSATNREKGISVKFVLTIFIDKSAKLEYQKDILSTPENPDEEGVIYFYPDKSARGRITSHRNGKNTGVMFKITPDRQFKIIASGGPRK